MIYCDLFILRRQIVVKRICTLLCFSVFVLISACSPNADSRGHLLSNLPNSKASSSVIHINPSVGTNSIPERIIIYNKGHMVVFNKDDTEFKSLKGFIYQVLSDKSINDQVKLAIVKGDVSELTKQLAIEFVYTVPVEFRYPDGSTQMITKFLIGPVGSSNKTNTFITAPANNGLYSGKLFVVQTDSSYEGFLLNAINKMNYNNINTNSSTYHGRKSGIDQKLVLPDGKVVTEFDAEPTKWGDLKLQLLTMTVLEARPVEDAMGVASEVMSQKQVNLPLGSGTLVLVKEEPSVAEQIQSNGFAKSTFEYWLMVFRPYTQGSGMVLDYTIRAMFNGNRGQAEGELLDIAKSWKVP
ncbi:hypothetical protein [Desulfosporosinus sp. FKA]|uniref:hypothetical protein n=1 Tax=Desulfosporosinus sp. FKA TaxID=1969834 RepID=UPI000B499E01|nr:hypothetical protein [Desulfosporosinus sp. FKA]